MTYKEAFDKVVDWIRTDAEYEKTRTFMDEQIDDRLWDDRQRVARLMEELGGIAPGRFYDEFKYVQREALLRFVERFGLSVSEPPAQTATAEPFTINSARGLAKKFGVPERALRGRLERYREDHPDCFISEKLPKSRKPRILYYEAEVMPIIQGLKGGQ